MNPVRDSGVIKVFYRVPIITQYFRWVENIIRDWNWGTSTKIRVQRTGSSRSFPSGCRSRST
ncbi:MAG: hypothetical protein MZU79_01455 [Anaerotruncus sp.]|nr:hypothetical protein [Anaerotruncus sp.]